MKKIIIITAIALVGFLALAQKTLHAKHGTIWVSFEESGHRWMVGALKEYASADDDPGFVQTDFWKGYAIKVNSGGNAILYHNCCATNIFIGTNYTGTIQIGTNFFTVQSLAI